MRKPGFIIFLIAFLFILIVIWVLFGQKNFDASNITATTSELEYSSGETLKVMIENNSSDGISFSDCYPYYFERQLEGNWVAYNYEDCGQLDATDNSIQARASKTFEIIVPELSELQRGVSHRLMIPVCKNCQDKNIFEKQFVIYSNEFLIN